ncbi:MAG: Fe-S cluster assembly protein SufD [Lysobacterales bacterium]
MSLLESLLTTAPEPAPWQAGRDANRAIVQAQGLPNRGVENWKYTALRALEGKTFAAIAPSVSVIQPEDLSDALPDGDHPLATSHRLVFVDGRFAPALCHGDNQSHVVVKPLSELAGDDLDRLSEPLGQQFSGVDEGFAALNTILASDGAAIHVSAASDDLSSPVVELLFLETGAENSAGQAAATAVRNVVHVDAGAELTLLERHVVLGGSEAQGPGGLINSVGQIFLAENATVNHLRLPTLSPTTALISRADVNLKAGANYACNGLDISGELVRHDLNVQMEGEGAHGALAGVYAPNGKTHVDIHCKIDHRLPNATSSQDFRGVMMEASRAVFNGKVVVREGADGTDASQSNANLLLSDNAEIDTKPELEIYADDVKCAHGTTVGALSEDQLFYLTARGIEPEIGRQMLTTAFCREILETIPSESLRDHALAQLENHLQETSS